MNPAPEACQAGKPGGEGSGRRVLEVRALRRTFGGHQALRGIDLSLEAGSVLGLVGPDGAGKTTLLRVLAGLLRPSSGRVQVLGEDPATGKLRHALGYMPQKFGLYEDLSVLENLSLHADLRGVRGAARSADFERLLAFTDLAPFTARRAGRLSGGMKQKLGLACALLGSPSVLLLDEPCVGVDPRSRRELWRMVQELAHTGLGILWSTSYLDEAERCDRVVLLNQGQALVQGKPRALLEGLGGRCFHLSGISGSPRGVLQRALSCPEVMDGVIQGARVRILLREPGRRPDLAGLEAGPGGRLVETAPNLEDAFVDALGGGPGGGSTLDRFTQGLEAGGDSPCLPSLGFEESLETDPPVIEARGLTRRFGDFVAVEDLGFTISRGEIFGLLGPNGAGKSTTFRMACGLLRPTTGWVRVMGFDLERSPSRARQQLGYMAQKFSLYARLTVAENLHFFSGLYGLEGALQEARIREMTEAFALEPLLEQVAGDLPLGFKQRLALACAVMHGPKVLFLDEPTSGVDPLTRREFWTHINALAQQGVTVMVTTHFMDEAEYCDRIGLVSQGRLVALDTPDALKARVATLRCPQPTLEEAFLILTQPAGEGRTEDSDGCSEEGVRASRGPVVSGLGAGPSEGRHGFVTRLGALCLKEFRQILRDPSSVLVAFVLPLILLFVMGYAINLDAARLRIGLWREDGSGAAQAMEAAFEASPAFDVVRGPRGRLLQELEEGRIRAVVGLPESFGDAPGQNPLQVLTDGSEPNTAAFISAYVRGVLETKSQGPRTSGSGSPGGLDLRVRAWFNPSLHSRNFLVPGSIAVVMTLIGALLTSLVVAREWERGTMEALLATPVTRSELLLSKILPYYLLGLVAMGVCVATAVGLMGIPFRGSLVALFGMSSLFLGSALGLGLFLSSALRSQFTAALAALTAAFLPALMLSGFVFEIASMPKVLQYLTRLVPARYLARSLQTLFQAGDVTSLLLPNALGLALLLVFWMVLTALKTRRTLED